MSISGIFCDEYRQVFMADSAGYCDMCRFLDIIIGIFYNIFTKSYWGKTWKQFLLQMMKRI